MGKNDAKRVSRVAVRAGRVERGPRVAVESSQADYDAVIGQARALDAARVRGLSSDAVLAVHNLDVGVANVLAERARIARELPAVRVADLESAPALGRALIYACDQIDHGSDGTLLGRIEVARRLRRKLLRAAESLVEAGLVSARAVAKIKQGSGALDAARDCVALAKLFRERHAAIAGKTPVTDADVAACDAAGTALLGLLHPRGAKRAPSAALKGAIDARDRIWTLVLERFELVWRVGAYLVGPSGIDSAVPLLRAKAGHRRAPKAATPAAPAGASA